MPGQRPARNARFLLDEGLPSLIADVLQSVGYPITSNYVEGLDGWGDPELISWMAERSCTWVTKDDAARSEHGNAILRARISVVWIRGVERHSGTTAKNNISTKDLHRMLTDKLDDIVEELDRSRGPRYFLLYMRGKGPVLKKFSTLEDVSRQLDGSRRSRARQNR